MTPPRRPPMRRILTDLSPHRRLLALGTVAAAVAAAASAIGPLAVGVAIDRGVLDRELAWVLIGAASFFVAAAVQLGATWAQTRWMGRFAHNYMRDLRRDLLEHLFALDLDFFTRVRTGRLVSRLTSDVDNLQQFVEHGLALVGRTALLILATLAVMLASSWVLTVVVVVALMPLGVATAWFRRRAYVAQVDVRDRMADLLGHVSESLTGARVIQAYTYEDPRREAFSRVNDDTYAAKVETVRLSSRFYLVLEFVSPASIAAVIGVGAWLAADGSITVGTVVAFTLYVGRLFEPIQQLTELAAIIQAAAASYGKVYAFRDERPLVSDAPDAVEFVPRAGEVLLDHVSFRYDRAGPAVIRDVRLHVPAGP
ncbi:MAG TPA: ABC transporter ATP-binding protein, partial [Nitriliruptorales bacterium]